MKIVINKKIVNGPWGGGNQILVFLIECLKANGIDVAFDIEPDMDAVLLMDCREGSCSFPLSKLNGLSVPIIHRINDTGIHRKGDYERTVNMLKMNEKYATHTVFISEWVKDYYVSEGFVGPHTVIDNATDRSLFYPSTGIRTKDESIKIVTHHWSDNISKGYDFYKYVDKLCEKDKRFSFKFIGREHCSKYFSSSCRFIGPQHYTKIANHLRNEDVYLSASLHEAGGCHIVEGMACGLIPFVRDGGGGTEAYSKGFNRVFSDENSLMRQLEALYNDYDYFVKMKNNIVTKYRYKASDMGDLYLGVIREELGENDV